MPTSRQSTSDYQHLFLSGAKFLDVRAPVEFNRGAFPGAVNIPILEDDERQKVGLHYKQFGQGNAIALGNCLVSGDIRRDRIQRWLQHAKDFPEGYLYCYRGGLRSQIAQQWLAEHGCVYPLVHGGYKALRQFLLDTLERGVQQLQCMIIAGRTGSGKTLLLKKTPCHIDLEELAKHRGSSFGGLIESQPSNINFENAIAIELLRYHHAREALVYLEDEGRMIGSACVPQPLREKMQRSPIIVLQVSLERRVEISLTTYVVELLSMYQRELGEHSGFNAFVYHHELALKKIVKRFGSESYQKTMRLFQQAVNQHRSTNSLEGYRSYITKLLCEYYDPMYDYQITKKQPRIVFQGDEKACIQWVQNASMAGAIV